MTFKIEYLRPDGSVCRVVPDVEGTLNEVEDGILARLDETRSFGATTYQIRDMTRRGRIICVETF